MTTTLRACALIACAAGLVAGCASSKTGTGAVGSATSPTVSLGASSSTTASTMPPPSLTSSESTENTDSSGPATSASAGPGDLSAFVGHWTGHDRSLTISSAGVGTEFIGDGCCDPQVDVTFQLSGAESVGSNGKATLTVTAVTKHSGYDLTVPAPKVGDVVAVAIADGVFTEGATDTTYCDPTAEAKGTCGA